MPTPTRFSSVRTGSRPAIVRKPTFRDDSNLVGFRYDKTIAAEPPVHITTTPRGAAASTRSRPSLLQRSPSSSTTTSSSGRSYAASVSGVSLSGTAATSINGVPCGGGPVVVAPPRLNLPVVAPPTEQHPALRSPPLLPDEWKRDSGHGSAIMKDTIHEEERLNVAGPSALDDCFVEKKRPLSRHATTAATRTTTTPAAAESAVLGRRRGQSLINNDVRPATARAATTTTHCIPSSSTTTAAPSNKTSACATGAPANDRPATTATTAAARASDRWPSSVIGNAALDLRVASSSSSTSSSSHIHPPAVAITASNFLPAPLSPPPSPSRSLSRRKFLLNRRLSLWGGSRDRGATTTPAHHPPPQPRKPTPRAPRRWHSASQLRGESTTAAGSNNNTSAAAATDIIPGPETTASGPAPGAAPAPTSSANNNHKRLRLLQLPLSPARSRSSRAMSSPSSPDTQRESAAAAAEFSPLGIAIPTESLLDDDFLSSLHFSKRGSLMFDPDNPAAMDRLSLTDDDDRSATPTQHSSVAAVPRPASSATSYVAADDQARTSHPAASPAPDLPAMTPDVEQESQKVRQLYASGEAPASLRDSTRHSYCDRLEPTPEVLTEDDESVANGNTLAAASSFPNSASSLSQPNDDPCAAAAREPVDPAGGFEDWDDLDSAMVDRYGFIGTPRSQSRVGTPTDMHSAHYSPRRRNVLTKRDPMGFASSSHGGGGGSGGRLPSRKVSARSLHTQHSQVSLVSLRSSRSVLRQAGNLLPQNRNRRWMDEAGDMLTVSPNLQDSVEEARVEKISEALKRKEIDRSEKWRRMARVVPRHGDSHQGQGMEFDFDTRNPKLVERTWKGIPDRWRAAAWWSFLATSARERPGAPTEDAITTAFRALQDRASADDIQIDLDVPRTISRHVMFRRRYRGGQRLLFRVLHALSLYFPETGYVQGMASLAATLLCYFDEEKCFVMLVRMWQLRGLERLYRPGFEGLLAALREFETAWLHRDVRRKMDDLAIDATAYGTRWYLTLFNLSIPFAAQLRVWDVFLLLGDPATGELLPPPPELTPKPSAASLLSLPSIKEKKSAQQETPSSGLDVLHAASAALIQALREVLLDADFENAMKALTAWIPIKDEDLLMKVARAEWKSQLKKRS